MHARSIRGAVLFAAFAACAPSSASAPVGALEGAIQGGAVDVDDPAVGALIAGGLICTATLIAPNVVLTAAHCKFSALGGGPFYTFRPSADGGPPERVAHALDRFDHHTGYRGDVENCPQAGTDVAIARLREPILDVAPARSFLADAPGPSPAVGARCRAVGFGRHDAAGDDGGVVVSMGEKRTADETIDQLSEGFVAVTAASGILDKGDSGGPLLCDGAVVGVASCSPDGTGAAHTRGVYARVDGVADWVRYTIDRWTREDAEARVSGDGGAALRVDGG